MRRAVLLWAGAVALCFVIALDVIVMVRSRSEPKPAGPAGSVEPPAIAVVVPRAAGSAAVKNEPSPVVGPSDPAVSAFDEEGNGDTSEVERAPVAKSFKTVEEAAARSCSTASVRGLSEQIVEESHCLNPRAFARLPTRSNLHMAPHVLPYLEASARNRLVEVLDKHKTEPMTVNSALRTVAQQYLVWRWSAGKRCGVRMATPPGESNHEAGLALDIADDRKWRPALEAADFKWLGASDRVHFDFRRRERPPGPVLDVLAFQKLWNLNHPTDRIRESGKYDAATESRLKLAPPNGFRAAPRCNRGSAGKRSKI